MSKDTTLAFLKEHSPVVFSSLQEGKYIQFDVLTFEHWKEGYKMPYTAHYNVLHSPEGLILEVLPPDEAERVKAYRIATAEQLISDYLEQRKSSFDALHYPPAQAAEREAVERALTDPTALHIEAPAGDISPSHTTPFHKSPSNFIAAAYKRLTPDNYYSEIHAEDPRTITTYPLLMAEALRRYADWIDSKAQAQAAQIIAEAEAKAARLFEDWQSRKRYTLEEGNPQVLAELRRRHIQHHERTFIPYLDFEGATRPELLSRLKFILREVKAGRDTRTNPAHLTNRLAHRMTNAQIITYLGGLVKEQEPRKAEPEQLPEFTELTGPITQALQKLDLLSDTGRYIGSKGQIKTLFNALERKGYLVGNRSTTEQFSKYFQTTFCGKVTGRALRDPLTIDQEKDLSQYKAVLPKKISSQSSHGKHGKHGKP